MAVNDNILARHDIGGAELNQILAARKLQGFRPIALSVYGDPSSPLYALVMAKRDGPDWVATPAVDAKGYYAFFDKWTAQGYSPAILTATGSAAKPAFAAVYEKGGKGWKVPLIDLVYDENGGIQSIQNWLTRGQKENAIPRWISVYGEAGNRRYALVLEENVNRENWAVEGLLGEDAGRYQQRFAAQTTQWAYPAVVSITDDLKYVALFRGDNRAPWKARHNLTAAQYQDEVSKNWAEGYFPAFVDAGGSATDRRYATLLVKSEAPKPRKMTPTGLAVKGFEAIDAAIQQSMKDSGTRAVSLAVVRKGKLAYARAFTWGEDDYPVTQPTTTFRIASCTKPITSMALHRLAQERGLNLLDRKFTEVIGLFNPFVDKNLKRATLHHLLTHSAGFGNIPDVTEIADFAKKTSLPVSLEDFYKYMINAGPFFTPGFGYSYSNAGFGLLGWAISQITGKSYGDYVRDAIFQPLGLTRPHLTRSEPASQPPGSARQHDNNDAGIADLRVVESRIEGPVHAARPLAALPYGGEDYRLFQSFGGWAMASVDYAKILGSLDQPDGKGILNKNVRQQMFAKPPYEPWTGAKPQTYVSGWDSYINGAETVYQHGGGMPGVLTRICYRADKQWGFAIFANGPALPDPYAALSNIADTAWPSHDLFPSVGIPSF